MNKVVYIGAFPPPYGGVTVKNNNLYIALSEHLDIQKIDLGAIKQKDLRVAVRLIQALLDRENTFVIGVAGKKTRKRFCKLLYFCNRAAMRRSIIFLMGGTASRDIAADKEYQKYMAAFKKIYVETIGMQRELNAVGLKNVGIYPNCRFRPDLPPKVGADSEDVNGDERLKCVFFSLIQPQKGADLVIEAAKETPGITYAFYGHIDEDYREAFLAAVASVKNIEYRGVFQGTTQDVCQELRKYDVLLFPTKWDIEGVPGILVEAKMAGIACVVSDRSYNAEIIADGEEGIVLKENTVEALVGGLRILDADRALLGRMKKNNKRSASAYYLENHISEIEETCGGGRN